MQSGLFFFFFFNCRSEFFFREDLFTLHKTVVFMTWVHRKKGGSVWSYLTMAITAAPAPARAQTNKWNVMLSYSKNTSQHPLIFSYWTFKVLNYISFVACMNLLQLGQQNKHQLVLDIILSLPHWIHTSCRTSLFQHILFLLQKAG